MENAVDALKIAFAVIVLVIALSVSIISFNNVKATSDFLLYFRDKTNFYEYKGATGKATENRIVGLETIIPTLYRYYKENYTVVFRQGTYNETTGEFSNVSYLNMYKTNSTVITNHNSSSENIQDYNNYQDLMNKKYTQGYKQTNPSSKKTYSQDIFSFDLDEEILRREPWTGSINKAKSNLDAFLNGSTYINPSNNQDYINYGSTSQYLNRGGFIGKYKNAKFVETVREYSYKSNATSEEENKISSLTKDKTKRVIIYTLIKN